MEISLLLEISNGQDGGKRDPKLSFSQLQRGKQPQVLQTQCPETVPQLPYTLDEEEHKEWKMEPVSCVLYSGVLLQTD